MITTAEVDGASDEVASWEPTVHAVMTADLTQLGQLDGAIKEHFFELIRRIDHSSLVLVSLLECHFHGVVLNS